MEGKERENIRIKYNNNKEITKVKIYNKKERK